MRTSAFLILPLGALGACTSAAPAPTCATPQWYAITHVVVPEHAGDGTRLGFDLDGNGEVDNAYASLAAAVLDDMAGLADPQMTIDARVARQEAPWLVSVAECDDGTARVGFHDARLPHEGADLVVQVHDAGAHTGSGGDLDVPLTVIADPLGTFTPIAWHQARAAAVDLHVDAAELDGRVGWGLPMPDGAIDLAAPYAVYLTMELAAGTSPFAARIDTDHDGVISAEELVTSDFGKTLLYPDVELPDGTQVLSFGLGVHGAPIAAP